VVILITLVAGYYWRSNNNLKKLLDTKIEELQKANLDIGRANTKIADANTLVDRLNNQIKEEIKKRGAVLSLYAELQARYEVEKNKVKTITKIVYKDRTIDIPAGKLFVKLEDNSFQEVKSLTYSYKDFRINIDGDAIQSTLSYKLHQRFRAVMVESKVPGGAINHYAELYEMGEKGEDLAKLKLEKFDVVKSEELKASMKWWNPKLDLMLGAGVNPDPSFIWTGDVGITFSSYGKTEDDISWRFFRIAAGITNTGISMSFSPVQYNVGKNLPLVSNLWLTPYAGFDFYVMKPHFGLGISVVF